MVDRDRVLSELSYNPETGQFIWLVTNRIKRAGAIAGHHKTNGYIHIGFDGKAYKAHRLAWLVAHGSWPSGQIDHINRNRSDNRICNLRDVTPRINAQNRSVSKSSSSGVMGVSWHPTCKAWQSQITAHGRLHYLGTYKTAEAAGIAYQNAKRRLHDDGSLIEADLRALNHEILKQGPRKC